MTLNEFWSFISSLEKRYALFRSTVTERFSLTAAEADILLFLANNPGRDTAAQIAKTRKIAKSHVSLAVKGLTERGFIEPYYEDGNKKSAHLRLLPLSHEAVEAGRAMQEKFAALLFHGFSGSERAEFSRLNKKIAQNLEDLTC